MSVEPVTGAITWAKGPTTVTIDLVPADVVAAQGRMWSRLARAVTEIPDEDWEHPTRCSEWRAVDIVNHLADINTMGFEVVLAALQRERSGVFEGFDPRTVPKQLTDAADRTPAVARERLSSSIEAMLAGLDTLDVGNVDPVVETPIGRQPLAVAMLHVLWDTWLHERDIFLPLGHSVPELEDEVRLAALYSLRMIGFFQHLAGRETHVVLDLHGAWEGILRLDVAGGDVRVQYGAGAPGDPDAPPPLRADATTAVDALCGRADLASALAGPEEQRAALACLRSVLGGS